MNQVVVQIIFRQERFVNKQAIQHLQMEALLQEKIQLM